MCRYYVVKSDRQNRGAEQLRGLPHRPGPSAHYGGDADGAGWGNLVEGQIFADGARYTVSAR